MVLTQYKAIPYLCCPCCWEGYFCFETERWKRWQSLCNETALTSFKREIEFRSKGIQPCTLVTALSLEACEPMFVVGGRRTNNQRPWDEFFVLLSASLAVKREVSQLYWTKRCLGCASLFVIAIQQVVQVFVMSVCTAGRGGSIMEPTTLFESYLVCSLKKLMGIRRGNKGSRSFSPISLVLLAALYLIVFTRL